MTKEKLQRGLGVFLDAMRPYVVSVVQRECGDGCSWDEDFENRLNTEKRRTNWQMQRMQLNNQGSSLLGLIDYNNLVAFVINYKEAVTREVGGNNKEYNKMRSCLQEIQETRNNWAHFDSTLDQDEQDRCFSNMIQVSKLLEMPELEEELKRINGSGSQQSVDNSQPNSSTITEKPTNDDVNNVAYNGVLTAWYNNILPQYDIRNGKLDESIFAANIEEVASQTAPVVYQDIVSFFDRTYITDGLKELVRRVVQALNGKESQNRVISLQTGFGGGKTHSLITLYHVVKDSRTFRDLQAAQSMLEPDDFPQFDNAKVAVFTQHTVSVTDGRFHEEDGITTHTLWGELAWQLGGKKGYELLRNADEQGIAPSALSLKPIIEGAAPALILIDELADYCARAAAKRIGGSNLFIQTNSFMQTLTEVVAAVPKTVLLCTLPASAREVASTEIGQEILSSLETRVIRVGCSVKPVDDEEVYEVVRRRLFDKVENTTVIEQVAAKYKKMYSNRRDSLPIEADKMAYAERIKKAYPFHPELIDMFRNRWGSDSRFQRTRGVLRLLASIVKDLWQRRSSLVGTQALIHTSDVQLDNLPTLQSQITSLMGAQWDSVMHADLIGNICNARKIDEQNTGNNIGKFRLGTAVTTTVLMASVDSSANKGLTLKQLKLCLLKPDAFQHIDIDSTLSQLENIVHYMYRSSIGGEQKYWFQAKPNINILINQAKGDVKESEINAEILSMLKRQVMAVSQVKLLVDPSGDIPEQKQLTFVLMHPKHTVQTGGDIPNTTKHFIKNIAQMRGNTQRIYRNTILFLLCSEAGRAVLATKLREYLACGRIMNEYGSQLDKEQKDDIAERKRNNEQAAKEQLIHAYCTIAKCVRDDIKTYEVTAFSQDMASQITNTILTELRENSWVLRRISLNVISRNGLMPTVEKPVAVKEVYEAFLRFDDKPMLLSMQAVTDTVNRYCEENMWNVGTGEKGRYTRIYHGENIPFLNPQEEGYWLLDPSVTMQGSSGAGSGAETGSGSSTGATSETGSGSGSEQEHGEEKGTTGSGTPPKTYRRVVIEGSIPMENYSQLFQSFVQTLRHNNLKIEMKFSAESTQQNPLAENVPIVKSIIESASQLGLNINFEEKD